MCMNVRVHALTHTLAVSHTAAGVCAVEHAFASGSENYQCMIVSVMVVLGRSLVNSENQFRSLARRAWLSARTASRSARKSQQTSCSPWSSMTFRHRRIISARSLPPGAPPCLSVVPAFVLVGHPPLLTLIPPPHQSLIFHLPP